MNWEDFFIDPKELPEGPGGLCQLTFLLASYGYILFCASNMIANGSELLLLTPLAGLVGSVVLPVLGAVPDGAIVLFSGMGPNAQEQLSVGVGALAGSTVMLLTVPWFLSCLAGRVDIEGTGTCRYSKPKLSGNKPFFTGTGVQPTRDVRIGAQIMLLTALSYLLIQVPAMFLHGPKEEIAAGEHVYALIGLCVCMASFVAYLVYQYRLSQSGRDTTHQMVVDAVIVRKIAARQISLLGALQALVRAHHVERTGAARGARTPLLPPSSVLEAQLRPILHPFFLRYDADASGHIDRAELGCVMSDLGVHLSSTELSQRFQRFDADHDGCIVFEEFLTGTAEMLRDPELYGLLFAGGGHSAAVSTLSSPAKRGGSMSAGGGPVVTHPTPVVTADEEEEEDEGEEMPAEFVDLPPAVQQRRIVTRSCLMMGAGTALVLIFADPMVGVMSEFGARISVPPFYVSFVLAPLASNASELLASFGYALKKTSKSITISLTALEGAGSMNNTFTLGVFMMLIYTQGLAWQFTAETLAILAAELCVGLIAMRRVQTMWMALLVLCVYPASLALVCIMEAYGFD